MEISWDQTIEFDSILLAQEEMGDSVSWQSRFDEVAEQNGVDDPHNDSLMPDFANAFTTSESHLESALDSCQTTCDGIETIVHPSENDVVCGKGGRRNYPGNLKFRAECQRQASRFLQNPTPKVKEEVAMELVGFVMHQGGHFLEDSGNKGTWRIVKFEQALKKAKQLLADVKKNEDKATRSGMKRGISEACFDDEDAEDSPSLPRRQRVFALTNSETRSSSQPHKVCPQYNIMEQLSAAFQQRGTVASLVGEVGVGKSFLADAFVNQWIVQHAPHNNERRVFWVRAATKSSARNSLIDILQQVDTENGPQGVKNLQTEHVADRVLKTLRELPDNVEWMMVVDNISDDDGGEQEIGMESNFLLSLLSELSSGRVLVTTRNETYGGNARWGSWTTIKVCPLDKTSAASLFQDQVQGLEEESYHAAMELVDKHFHGLPLAIVTAAREIALSGVRVVQYVEKLRSFNIFKKSDEVNKIASVLDSSIAYARSLKLGNVLDIVAWLNPDQMERHLLPADDDALERLCALNILSKDTRGIGLGGGYSMHRIFQAAVRSGCSSPSTAIEAVRRNGLDKFSRHHHETWGPAFLMLPHVDSFRACVHRGEIVHDDDKVACADLMNQSGHVAMWASCNYVAAKESYQAALEIVTQVYSIRGDSNNIRIATNLKDLGRLHQALGEYSSARQMYTEALRMMRAVGNENTASPVIATTLHNLGRVCLCLGNTHEAEQHFHTSLQMKQDVQAPITSIALTMANIGRIHQAAGRCKEALAQYQSIERIKGINYRSVFGATTRLSEGQVYQDVGDLNTARLKYEQALEVYDEVFGIQAKNDAIAMAHCYLGSILVDLCDLDGAHIHLNIALDMMRHVFGATAKHDNIANATYHMGRLCEKRGDQRNARLKYGEAKLMLDELIGEEGSMTTTLGKHIRRSSEG